jgi:hypothetical protein
MTVSPEELEWLRWSRENPTRDMRAAWAAAYHAGEKNGLRTSMQLGVGATIQQLADILERMERVAHQLADDEIGSPYWRSEA